MVPAPNSPASSAPAWTERRIGPLVASDGHEVEGRHDLLTHRRQPAHSFASRPGTRAAPRRIDPRGRRARPPGSISEHRSTRRAPPSRGIRRESRRGPPRRAPRRPRARRCSERRPRSAATTPPPPSRPCCASPYLPCTSAMVARTSAKAFVTFGSCSSSTSASNSRRSASAGLPVQTRSWTSWARPKIRSVRGIDPHEQLQLGEGVSPLPRLDPSTDHVGHQPDHARAIADALRLGDPGPPDVQRGRRLAHHQVRAEGVPHPQGQVRQAHAAPPSGWRLP